MAKIAIKNENIVPHSSIFCTSILKVQSFDFESTENTPLCAFGWIGEVKAIEKVGFCKPDVHWLLCEELNEKVAELRSITNYWERVNSAKGSLFLLWRETVS